MGPEQELLQKWDGRASDGRRHPRLEITSEGMVLGAGTILAKMARDGRGAQRLTLDDEPRAMALLAAAYERPVDPYVLRKLRRVCELWNEEEKVLAHIHLAHARLPPCDEEQALRLFVADELLEAGVTPAALMQAQGFDPAPLALLKYNPDRPRVPAGSGRESGQWKSDGAVIPASYRTRARMKALGAFIEWLKSRLKGSTQEKPPEKTPPRKEAKPAPKPSSPSPETLQVVPSQSKPSDFIGQDFGKLGAGVEKPDLGLTDLRRHGVLRSGEREVLLEDMQTTVSNPLIVLRQSQGQYLYLSDRAVVVLTPSGEVITTYPASSFDARIMELLDFVRRGNNL